MICHWEETGSGASADCSADCRDSSGLQLLQTKLPRLNTAGGEGEGVAELAGEIHECCQVAEISAKKLVSDRGKKSWLEEFVANFAQILPKLAEKEPKKIFWRSSLFCSTDKNSETKTKFNLHF